MAVTTITKVGAFTQDLADQINTNFSSVGSGGTFASPAITGTVAGGASYTAPTLTSPTITGTTTIGAGATLTTPALGAATATSIAIGGATLGSNALAVTGHLLLEGVTSTGATGTGALVFSGTPTLVTPVLGAATGTSVVLSGDCRAATFHAGATAGVTAGPFTTVSSIATIGGLVTTLTGT